ncbi:hypothetical protein SAMN04487967_0689 [Natronorubrum sediminis]|uniref:Uncharacterized protein n=1 Tax=Natronorubrum sediminis TaxID=640943 RepID=A0A1H6FMS0_9EURY|nr:hypothetical protein SAMN04487967_0689 [Natronorubrum sediminis]
MCCVGRVSSETVDAASLQFPLSWMLISTAMEILAATIALVSQYASGPTTIECVSGACFVGTDYGLLRRQPLPEGGTELRGHLGVRVGEGVHRDERGQIRSDDDDR